MQDLAAIRLQLAEVLNLAAGAGADAALLISVSDGVRDAFEELDRRRWRSTPAQLNQFQRIADSMRDYSATERREAICTRMGIGRSRYFELQSQVRSPDRTAGRQSGGKQLAPRAGGPNR